MTLGRLPWLQGCFISVGLQAQWHFDAVLVGTFTKPCLVLNCTLERIVWWWGSGIPFALLHGYIFLLSQTNRTSLLGKGWAVFEPGTAFPSSSHLSAFKCPALKRGKWFIEIELALKTLFILQNQDFFFKKITI